MSNLSIFMLGPYPPDRGGVANVVKNICDILQKDNDIYISVKNPIKKSKASHNERMVFFYERFFHKRGSTYRFFFRSVRRAFQMRKSLDLYHAHSVGLAGVGFIDKKRPLVLTIHGYASKEMVLSGEIEQGSLVQRYMKWLERKAVGRADAVIAVGNDIHDWCIEELGARPEKVFYVPNGIDEMSFKAKKVNRKEILKRYSLTEKNKVVLFAKSIVESNGIRTLIGSLPRIVKRYPETRLLILGVGGLKDEMRSLSKELGVEKNIIFFGLEEHGRMPDIFNCIDAFCTPFIPVNKKTVFGVGDTIGISQLEAMACEVPTIGTKSSVKKGAFGYELNDSLIVVRPKDTKGLANAILHIFDDDAESKRLGKRAREYIVKNHTWKSISGEVLKVYDHAIACRR